VASMPQSVGWQFMGHIVRIVRGPIACASIGSQYTGATAGP